jgi:predicted SAM-dependent methyltransferase
MRLNLGAGTRILPGHVNVDKVRLPGVDTVHDLDVAPWPWKTGTVLRVEAKDVFEHVDDPVTFMTECHRVLRRGGILHLRTPHWKSMDSFTDPTHKRHPTEHTFDYWIPGTALYKASNAAYGGVAFERLSLFLDGQMDVTLRKPGG